MSVSLRVLHQRVNSLIQFGSRLWQEKDCNIWKIKLNHPSGDFKIMGQEYLEGDQTNRGQCVRNKAVTGKNKKDHKSSVEVGILQVQLSFALD